MPASPHPVQQLFGEQPKGEGCRKSTCKGNNVALGLQGVGDVRAQGSCGAMCKTHYAAHPVAEHQPQREQAIRSA